MNAMNKKITARNERGIVCYCILSGEDSIEEQFNLWYFDSRHPGGGVCVRFDTSKISVVDYFHAESMADFEILSIEDTDEPVMTKWFNVKTGNFGWA
jgi:hypothetical protein